MISRSTSSLRLGVLSDTHGLVRPETLRSLDDCDVLLHAGDVCGPEVLAELERIAPVHAVRGNNDVGAWARDLPVRKRVEIEGVTTLVVHDSADVRPQDLDGVDLVVCGHSHRPRLEERDGVTWLNPGSAGPRRFTLPVTLARVDVCGGEFSVEHVELVPRESTQR